MSDGLVRKDTVLKIINLYFAECAEHTESDEECLRLLQYDLDLNILIDNAKEVKDD